jgi:AraC family transcriptional regulator
MEAWEIVRKVLGTKPVVSTAIGGVLPLRAERYFLKITHCNVPALQDLTVICHLGGGRVFENWKRDHATDYIPSLSAVLPANCPSEWQFSSAIDVAIFYVPRSAASHGARLHRLVGGDQYLHPFNDPLVSAMARQIVDELGRGTQTDHLFAEKLSALMIEQCCRSLEGATGGRAGTDMLQRGQLEVISDWIRENLAVDLSNAVLAKRVGLSESHFRRVFLDTVGTTPQRYVLTLRLERVHELLTGTDLSIARIAAECGFNSQSHMTYCFSAAFDLTPSKVRKKARTIQLIT